MTRFRLGSSATGSVPIPQESVGSGLGSGHSFNSGPAYEPGSGYSPAPIAKTSQGGFGESDLTPLPQPKYQVVGRHDVPPPTLGPPLKQPAAAAGPGSVAVRQGDTIYSIARQYGVAAQAIKDANGLTSDTLRPGQRLVIPSGTYDSGTAIKVPSPGEPKPVKTVAIAPPPAEAAPTPGWDGTHVLKPGESLYAIAQQHKVSLEELKRVNGIADPTKVWSGTVLKVPSRPDAVAAPAPPPGPKTPLRVINATDKTAKRSDVATDASPPPQPQADASNGKFRWPVRGGRTIVGFGKRPDGTHNDGINLAVPLGADVFAVEAGKVAYAGNELKGYGNLVLIRHDNGWVSAYAHADQILVRANDQVRKGQVIAKAGKTGAVTEPQLHFELRQGSRPVDPLPHLASN